MLKLHSQIKWLILSIITFMFAGGYLIPEIVNKKDQPAVLLASVIVIVFLYFKLMIKIVQQRRLCKDLEKKCAKRADDKE